MFGLRQIWVNDIWTLPGKESPLLNEKGHRVKRVGVLQARFLNTLVRVVGGLLLPTKTVLVQEDGVKFYVKNSELLFAPLLVFKALLLGLYLRVQLTACCCCCCHQRYTVQTEDLILPCIWRISQMHSCIEKKILLKSLFWLGGKFMLSTLQAGWDRSLVRISNLTQKFIYIL